MKMKYLLKKHDLGRCCVVISCILLLHLSLFFGQGTSSVDILTKDEDGTINTTTNTIVLDERVERGYLDYLTGDKVNYDSQGWTGLAVEIQSATYDAAGVTLNYFNTDLSFVELDIYSGDDVLVSELSFYDTGSIFDNEDVQWIGKVEDISLQFYIANFDGEFSLINLEYTIEGKSSNSLEDIPDDSTSISLDQEVMRGYRTRLESNLRNYSGQGLTGFTIRLHQALYPATGVLVDYFDTDISRVYLNVYSGSELVIDDLSFSSTDSFPSNEGREDVEWVQELTNISLLFYISNYNREVTRVDIAYTIEGEGLTNDTSGDTSGDNEGANQENSDQKLIPINYFSLPFFLVVIVLVVIVSVVVGCFLLFQFSRKKKYN